MPFQFPILSAEPDLDRNGDADKNELKQYVERISGNLKKIVCIHGEESQCLAHAETLRAMKKKAQVIVPEYKQVVEI